MFSLNSQEESWELIKYNYEGIKFVDTTKTIEYYVGRPLVMIWAMMDLARIQGQDLFIVNSDIELTELPELRRDGITIFSRYDWEELHTKANARMFVHGFDCFFIPKHLLSIFPPAIFAMGGAFHDLWTPYHAILNNVPVYYPKGIHAYHKKHETQYPLPEWYYLGKTFRLHFKLDENLPVEHMTTNVMRTIRSKLIHV
jgi:hypothetical protein